MALKERYMALSQLGRQQFLQRARHNALLTIPSLMPLEGHDQKNHLVEPYNGLGAAAIVHLSSRITMNLLPANRPHMRLQVPNEIKMQAPDGKVPEETQTALALSEQGIQAEVEALGWRTATLQSVQQLLVAGNVCEHMLPDGRIRVFRLDQYVTNRDYRGKVVEGIIEENLAENTTPEDISREGSEQDEEAKLYTGIMWDKGRQQYHITQELDGKAVGLNAWVSEEDLDYNFIRWSSTPGEDYGRSKVEEHIADFRSLDGLEKAGLELAAMAARNLIAVRPGTAGSTVKRRLTKGVNADVVMIDPEAIELKSFGNPANYQVVDIQMSRIVERVSRAFLLLSAGQRDAERVTATEIERDIQELEAALGGNFSVLNQEMMKKRTAGLMDKMIALGKLPAALKQLTEPVILTGLEALSRERDIARVRQLIEIAAPFGPEEMAATYNTTALLAKAAAGVGMPDVIRSAEEKAQIEKQRHEAMMQQQLAGPAIQAMAQGGE